MLGSEAGFAAIIGIFLFAFLFWAAILLAGYILKGLALSRMARNAGLPTPALAWVPFASSWLLGTLCDRSQWALAGKRWRFDLLLPALEVLAAGGGSLLAGPGGFFAERYLYAGFSYSTLRDAVKLLLGLCYLAVLGVALWYLFQDYAPERALPCVIFSVALGQAGRGVMLMTIRDKIPLSAGQPCGGPRPGGYPPPPPPGYGPGAPGPWQSGPGTTGWGPPPRAPGGPGTTGWDPSAGQGRPPEQGAADPGWYTPPFRWDSPGKKDPNDPQSGPEP